MYLCLADPCTSRPFYKTLWNPLERLVTGVPSVLILRKVRSWDGHDHGHGHDHGQGHGHGHGHGDKR